MTSPIDHLLARARLIDTPRTAPGARRAYSSADTPWIHALARRHARDDRSRQASADLRALCETAVTRAALDTLSRGFRTLPVEPDAARVLGCLLHLGHAPDAARFWWQYAAGDDDVAAAYCLALQHRSQGEETAATWWLKQIPAATEPDEDVRAVPDRLPVTDRPASLPTTLRILRRLRPDRRFRARQPVIAAVMDYVVVAIKFVDDDLDLPLPGPDFLAQIGDLTNPGSPNPPAAAAPVPHSDPDPLPARHRGGTAIRSAQRHSDWALNFTCPSA
ncbi:hypothetical protein ACFWPU_45525 [Streptomyces sp. NPDC058471]|uniref:hypothetical protein n=1 Tax=Streptomyces sp. NPDC058471 TaxID=3346516 RepID=UPI003652B85D